jgi:CheY-specific phosphatase CheX
MENQRFSEFTACFNDALREISKDMAGVELQTAEFTDIAVAKKYSVIIGIVGEYKGRALINFGSDLVTKITEDMNYGPLDNTTDIGLYMGEFANILCGKAVTNINNRYKTCELRLTPPAIFSGEKIRVITPKLQSSVFYYSSLFGQVIMDVGFEGGR